MQSAKLSLHLLRISCNLAQPDEKLIGRKRQGEKTIYLIRNIYIYMLLCESDLLSLHLCMGGPRFLFC